MAAIVTKDGVIEAPKSHWIAVCNISHAVRKEQIKKLFEYFGKILEFRLYPTDDQIPVSSKVAYVKFEDFNSSNGAIHLTNTAFYDRPLIVTPIYKDFPPDEETAISTAKLLASSDMSQYIIGGMIMQGADRLNLNLGFPHTPTKPILDAEMPSLKIDETHRTIFIYNLHPHTSTEILLALFSGVGSIKYIRLSDGPQKKFKFALIEYTDVHSVLPALQYQGFPIYGRPIQTAYSRTYIMKADDWKRRERRKSRSVSPHSSKRVSPVRYNSRPSLRSSRSPPPKHSGLSKRRSRSRDRSRRTPVRSRRSKSRSRSKKRKRSRSKEHKSSKKLKEKKDRSRSKDRSEKSSKYKKEKRRRKHTSDDDDKDASSS